MIRRHSFATVLVTILALGSMAPVSHGAVLGKGTVELQGSGSFSQTSVNINSDDFGTVTSSNLGLSFAQATSDEIMLGFTLSLGYDAVDPSGSASASQSLLGIRADFTRNFDAGESAVGFLQFSAGLERVADTSNSETNVALPRVTGGMRFLVGNSASLNVYAGAQYRFREDYTQTDLVAGFGFSVFPGGVK
jgi:hypothetical protein